MYWLPYATNMKRVPGKPGGSLIKWWRVLCACTVLVRRVVVVVVASPRKDRDTGAHLSCTRENGCSTARATQLRCTSPIRQPKQGPRDLYLSIYVRTYAKFWPLSVPDTLPSIGVRFPGVCPRERSREGQGPGRDRVDGWGGERWRGGRYGEGVGGRRERERGRGRGDGLGPRAADPYASGG